MCLGGEKSSLRSFTACLQPSDPNQNRDYRFCGAAKDHLLGLSVDAVNAQSPGVLEGIAFVKSIDSKCTSFTAAGM
jgi:hypothetical protein